MPKCSTAQHVAVLVVMVDHMSVSGRGCYASQETIAKESKTSVRTVRRCIGDFEAMGVFRRGDWRLVQHLRADRRPDVWDLAMDTNDFTTGRPDLSSTPDDPTTGQPDRSQPLNDRSINTLTTGQSTPLRPVSVADKPVRTEPEREEPKNLSLTAAAAREASRIDAAPNEREFEQPQKQDQPQERQPQQEPHVDDVAAAYAKARAEIGKPATPLERARIRISADELVQAGQSIEYLIRLAAWMGTEHPGWVDLARARTADGSPALIPRQRDDKNDGPCQEGACDGHDHLPCERGWIKLPTGLAHCPCSPMSKQRLSRDGYQTYRDADASTFRPPHEGWKNPTTDDAYDGEF